MNHVMIALAASLTVALPGAALAQAPAKTVVLASDIPVARTPPGFWKTFPAPVLARCTEPLAPGAMVPRFRPRTWAGALVELSVPRPSCPFPFDPQTQIVPSAFSATEK